MVKTANLYAKNILDSIESIYEITWTRSSKKVVEDRISFLAILSILVHIWETVSSITKNYPEEYIHQSRNIVDFRNILAHDYMAIRKWFVIKILDNSLTTLEDDCRKILSKQWDQNYKASFIEFSE